MTALILAPFGKVIGIPRALLQVPQGGAQKTPMQLGERIQDQQSCWPSSDVRSATSTRPAFFCLLWSTPKDAERPRDCRHDVTRAEPAQISIINGSLGMGLWQSEKLQKVLDWPSPVLVGSGTLFGGGCSGLVMGSGTPHAGPLGGSLCTKGRVSSGDVAAQPTTLRFFLAGSSWSSQDFL